MVTRKVKHRTTPPPKNIRNERYYLLYKGDAGYSAYEVAMANGFVGTIKEWLTSLKSTEAGSIVQNSYFPTGW